MKKAVLVFLLLLSGACARTEVTEEFVAATVIVQGSDDRFNEVAAVGGYILGRTMADGNGLLWGAAAGAVAAEGCRVPVLVEGQEIVLKAPASGCKLPAGSEVIVKKRTTVVFDDTEGRSSRRWVRYWWAR